MYKNILFSVILVIILVVGFSVTSSALTTLFPSGGGTGISTTTASNVGKFLQVSSSSPLRYQFASSTGGTETASSTFMWRANNGSDITSTSTFRNNLGLTDTALLASTTWYLASNPNGFVTSSIVTGYALTTDLSSYVPYTGANGTVDLGANVMSASMYNFGEIGSIWMDVANKYTFSANGGDAALDFSAVNDKTFAFPDETGTLALTSDITPSSTFAKVANNLSDLQSSSTARANLGVAMMPPFTIEFPSTSERDFVFTPRTTSTIDLIIATQKYTASLPAPTLTWNIGFASGTSASAATSSLWQVFTSAQTTTATTTVSVLTPNGSTTLSRYAPLIFWTTGTASSSQFHIDVYYHEN